MIYSYSKIDTFIKCPLRFKFEYIDLLPKVKSDFLIVGNILHSLSGEYLKTKDLNNTLLKMKLFAIQLDDLPKLSLPKDDWLKLMEMNLKQLLPYLPESYIDLEKKVEGQIGGYDFVGFVDILRSEETIELKFRKKYREPDTTQLNLYAKLLGSNLNGCYITSSFLGGVLSEKVEYQDPTEFLLKIIQWIERKEFFKKPSGLCNYCSFKEQCREVKE